MKASEAMVPDPHVAVAGAMASEVAIMLKTRNISVVPVVDDHRTKPAASLRRAVVLGRQDPGIDTAWGLRGHRSSRAF